MFDIVPGVGSANLNHGRQGFAFCPVSDLLDAHASVFSGQLESASPELVFQVQESGVHILIRFDWHHLQNRFFGFHLAFPLFAEYDRRIDMTDGTATCQDHGFFQFIQFFS